MSRLLERLSRLERRNLTSNAPSVWSAGEWLLICHGGAARFALPSNGRGDVEAFDA